MPRSGAGHAKPQAERVLRATLLDGRQVFRQGLGRTRETATDVHLVPQVIAEQAEQEPVRFRLRRLDGGGVEELVMVNLLDQRAKLSTGGEPLEDRLAERQLLPIGQLGVSVASEAALQERLRPAETET